MEKTIRAAMALLVLCTVFSGAAAQQSGSITVGGDFNTFYPVSWFDGGWASNRQTELHIGRASAHIDSQGRGAVMATFHYHTTSWGNHANFINAHIASFRGNSHTPARNFIAGWQDVTGANSDRRVVIWLRGGGTTYHYRADVSVSPVVYDGVQNALPYTTSNGSASYGAKTTEDDYVNHFGTTLSESLHVRSTGNSVLMGNVGIGTTNPRAKLAVNGNILAREVKVKTDISVPDYVFAPDYELPALTEIEAYVKEHRHLPEIPSSKDIGRDGLDLAEMDLLLLKKVEELTLHLIRQQKTIDGQQEQIKALTKTTEEKNSTATLPKQPFYETPTN